MEIWKEIKGFENYHVSNLGNVKNILTDKNLKGVLNKGNYLTVGLRKDKKSHSKYIHRLVAETFIEKHKSYYKLVVDHINSVKTDNRLENLQWISYRENVLKGEVVNKDKNLGVTPTYNGYFKAKISVKLEVIYIGCHKTNVDYLGKLYSKANELIHLYDGDKKKFRKLVKASVKNVN